MKKCKDCEFSERPRSNHPDVNDIEWIYCKKNKFDIVGYYYCDSYVREK